MLKSLTSTLSDSFLCSTLNVCLFLAYLFWPGRWGWISVFTFLPCLLYSILCLFELHCKVHPDKHFLALKLKRWAWGFLSLGAACLGALLVPFALCMRFLGFAFSPLPGQAGAGWSTAHFTEWWEFKAIFIVGLTGTYFACLALDGKSSLAWKGFIRQILYGNGLLAFLTAAFWLT